MNFTAEKPHQCSLCHRGFTRKFDLIRHEQNVHREFEKESEIDDYENSEAENLDAETEYEESESENSESSDEEEDETSNEEMSSVEYEDNAAYQAWYQHALEETQDMRNEKFQKYVNQGMDEERAKEKAYIKTLWVLQRTFFDNYKAYLWSNIHLKDEEYNQEIMDDLEEKINEGMDVRKALKRVIVNHRAKFDGLFQYDEDAETDDDESEDDDDEEGEEEENI